MFHSHSSGIPVSATFVNSNYNKCSFILLVSPSLIESLVRFYEMFAMISRYNVNWAFFKMDFYKDCYNKKALDIKMISETLILGGPGRFYLDSWYINCASKIPIERGGGGIIIQLRKITPSKNDSLIYHLNLRIQNVKALFLSRQFYPHRLWSRRELSSLRTTGFIVPCSAFSSACLQINCVGVLC